MTLERISVNYLSAQEVTISLCSHCTLIDVLQSQSTLPSYQTGLRLRDLKPKDSQTSLMQIEDFFERINTLMWIALWCALSPLTELQLETSEEKEADETR